MLTAQQHDELACLANEAGLGAWDGQKIARLIAFFQKVWPIIEPFIKPYITPVAPNPPSDGPVAIKAPE